MALGSTKPSRSQLNLSHTAARHARLSKRLAFKWPLCHFLVWRIRNVSGKHWKQPQKGAAFYKASAILSLCSGDDTTAASGARGGCKAKAPRVPHLPGAVQLCTLTSYRKHSIASPSGSHDVTDKAIRHSFVFPISSTRDFAPESVPLDPKARPGPVEWLEGYPFLGVKPQDEVPPGPKLLAVCAPAACLAWPSPDFSLVTQGQMVVRGFEIST